MEKRNVGLQASWLMSRYTHELKSLTREDKQYRWLIAAVKSCDELSKTGKKRLLGELRPRRREVVRNLKLTEELVNTLSKARLIGDESYCKAVARTQRAIRGIAHRARNLDNVWGKFTPTPLQLEIPEGMTDVVVNGIHVWMGYEDFRSYEFTRLNEAKASDFTADLAKYREDVRLERAKQIAERQRKVKEFFSNIFKELPKSERRKFDDAEELQLIVDEAKARYIRAKEDPEDFRNFYHRGKGDEIGREAENSFLMRAITTNRKVEARKSEAEELWTLRCRIKNIGHEMCKDCYRKGQSHSFCVKCHQMMAEELHKFKEQEEFELHKMLEADDSKAAIRKMRYVKKKILGVYRHPELDGKLMRWFLYGYSNRKQEDIINYLCTSTLLVERYFIDFNIDDALEIVKKKIASAKFFWRSGGYAGWTDRFDILEQLMLELLEFIKREMTKDWVYIPADAVDEDCGLKGLVKEVLPNGTIRYKMRAWVNKIDIYDSAKLVGDMEHLDDAEEVDAIEQVADKTAHKLFGTDIEMERLAHMYRVYNHPYYELLTSIQGVGKYHLTWTYELLRRFFELALKDFGYDLEEVFRKNCQVKRLDYKAMFDFYSEIAVWAKAHKMGEL